MEEEYILKIIDENYKMRDKIRELERQIAKNAVFLLKLSWGMKKIDLDKLIKQFEAYSN